MPRFSDARYDGETVELRNDNIRLAVHRGPIGWGWGELYAPAGDGDRYLGVLEHLGEVDCERFPRPLRLVADDVDVDDDALRFELAVQMLPDIEDFRDDDADYPEFTGALELSLDGNAGRIDYGLTVEARTDVELTRLRGPWLRVGADGFGADRDDGIFPGIDWVTGDEWSSGNDHIEHPEALRVAPHPNKVTIPTMAVSHDGVGISVSWDVADADGDLGRPQPVYATPNFVDRRDDSLLGLMRPGADADALDENALDADDPVSMAAGESTTLSASLSLTDGSSLDAVVDWVHRNGLPEPGMPRYEWRDLLDWIAECYATNLWQEGEGYGADVGVLDGGSPSVPSFLRTYVDREDADPDLVERIEVQIEWCERRKSDDDASEFDLGRPLSPAMDVDQEDAEALGERLLNLRRDDGGFPFDPDSRHHNFRSEWFDYSRPLGQPGETELGFCVEGGGALLLVGRKTADERFIDAGLETLEFATRFDKPAGDDWWETPIHGPNLFAGGKAAIAYALAYEETGEERHRDRARKWLRSLLPFTHLWEHDDGEMLYNTKPCLDASVWTVVSWVNNHVIWEVLTVFQQMNRLGIDWAELDPEIDWDRYQRGITTAVLRWMIDSRADDEYLDRFQFPDERMRDGEFDGLYADIFDPVEGTYAGGPIVPNVVAENALILLERNGE